MKGYRTGVDASSVGRGRRRVGLRPGVHRDIASVGVATTVDVGDSVQTVDRQRDERPAERDPAIELSPRNVSLIVA